MMEINEVFDEILRFSQASLTIYPGISDDEIKRFEWQHNLSLPNDYKVFLSRSNGLNLMGAIVFGIYDDTVFSSLGGSYMIEHHEVGNIMPLNLVPFSPDGGGNHFCFDINNADENSCQIVFWQHDYIYSKEDPPDLVAVSFTEWLKKDLIDWTLENYDYDGVKRK